MACPIASVAAAVATVGGARALLIQDRSFRHFTWLTLLTLTAGWWLYFIAARVLPLRVVLEIVTTLAIVGAVLRVRWLVRNRGIQLPLIASMTRILRGVWGVIGSPWVLSAKVWLAAMLVMDWRGKAHFTPLEYAIVCAILVVLVVARLLVRSVTRSPFASLEAIAATRATPACPFGFGCEVAELPAAQATHMAAGSAQADAIHDSDPRPHTGVESASPA